MEDQPLLLQTSMDKFQTWILYGIIPISSVDTEVDLVDIHAELVLPVYVQLPHKYRRAIKQQGKILVLADDILAISLESEELTREWKVRFESMKVGWLPITWNNEWLQVFRESQSTLFNDGETEYTEKSDVLIEEHIDKEFSEVAEQLEVANTSEVLLKDVEQETVTEVNTLVEPLKIQELQLEITELEIDGPSDDLQVQSTESDTDSDLSQSFASLAQKPTPRTGQRKSRSSSSFSKTTENAQILEEPTMDSLFDTAAVELQVDKSLEEDDE